MKRKSVKKALSLLLALSLCVAMAACGADNTPAQTQAPPATTELPTQPAQTQPAPSEITGGNWRTQRSYLGDYQICDVLSVCLSRCDDDSGYAVYNSANGERMGTLLVPEGETGFFEDKPFIDDFDGDGYMDIGVSTDSGMAYWYGFDPAMDGSWPDDPCGAFRRLAMPSTDEDNVCFPFEEPQIEATEGAWARYEEIYPKVVALEDFYYDVETYGTDFMEDLLGAFGIIKTIHPETRNYFMLLEDVDEETYDFYGMYSSYTCRWDVDESDDKTMIRDGIRAFEKSANDILSGLTDDMSAYEKYYYLASEISRNASYDYEFEIPGDEAPWAGIMGGMFICEGYSEAMEYLCRRANLYCKVVSGSSRGMSHAWNLVKLPGGTYYVDITWADEGGEPGSEGWMRYFLLTQDEILIDHEISDGTVATGQ